MPRKKRIAIIGASDFQNPLILRAKEKGIETHVFAWEVGDSGEASADYFHPISIMEKEAILDQCRELKIDGITTIGSDLANITVAYVANALGLTANSIECVENSTNKHAMRNVFEAYGDPSPKSILVRKGQELDDLNLSFPVIVKPSDRSGSRGITKVFELKELPAAIARAINESFSGSALVEEFACGREFSVEGLSWEGNHSILAITEKFTTGAPYFIETGHLEPARIDEAAYASICSVVTRALDHLGVKCGASHSEVKLDRDGKVKIIEIGSRMGGDCIGSDLVKLSTGYDYIGAVIDIALGCTPKSPVISEKKPVMIRFIFDEGDKKVLDHLQKDHSVWLHQVNLSKDEDQVITDSGSRHGFFIASSDHLAELDPYLPVLKTE